MARKKCLLFTVFLGLFFLSSTAQPVYTFTTAGASGRFGPTQLQANAAYALTNLNGSVTVVGQGIQLWTVPFSGAYKIEAWGASGGAPGSYTHCGRGASMTGEFTLTAGQVLKILVGQQGTKGTFGGSGGGGSFVVDNNNNNPLIVAGGGSGGGNYANPTFAFMDGRTTNYGPSYQSTGRAIASGGGGSFLVSGLNANGGGSFISGGVGGTGINSIVGGFGGGGGNAGANMYASGGGGYSGGDEIQGTILYQANEAGGGSFNSGTNQVNASGVNTGDGKVVITNLCPINVTTPLNPICNGNIIILTSNATGNYSWSTGATTPSIVVSPASTTTYSLWGTGMISTFTCQGSSFLTVTVNPLPSLNPSTLNSTICPGQTASLVVGGNPSTFTWQPGGQTGVFVTVSPTTTTIYTVTGTDANGCVNNANVTQSVLVTTTVVLSPSSSTICSGTTVSIAGSGAATYTWMPGGFTGPTFTTSLTSPAFYTVTGTSSQGCIGSTTASVSILPVPALSFVTASITCASLGSATVNASGGVGPYSYTWMPTAQTGPMATGLTPATYTLTTFDNGTGCVSTATTLFTSLIPLTGNLSNSSSITCNGASTGTANVSNFAGGSGNVNYIWTNGVNSYTNAFPQNLSAGQWSMNIVDALTGCPVFSVFTITQPPALTLQVSSNTPSACVGTNIVLSGSNSGGTPIPVTGYTYSWNPGPALDSQTVSLSSGTHNFTLNSSDVYGCLASGTVAVDFVPNPVLSISDVSICPLEIGTLTVSGATTYTWNTALLGNSLSDNPFSTTQYTVTGTALACTTIATANIILKPQPFPFLNSNSPVCNGKALSISAIGGTSFVWTGPAGFTSTLQTPALNPAAPFNSGVYHVTITAPNGCTATTSSSLTVNPTPTLSAIGSTVCTSQTMQLYSNTVPGVTFLWSGPLNFSSTLQDPFLVNPPVNRSGVYTVTATSIHGCTNVATAITMVVPPPSLTISLSSPSLCSQAFNGSKNSITLTSFGANTYTLQTPLHIANPNPDGPVSPLTSIPPYSGVATATLFGSNGVCSVSKVVSFSVIPNPTVGVSSVTPVICAGDSYTYTSNGASSYTWGPKSPGITTYSTGQIAVAHPSISSVFSVFGGSLGCYSAMQTTSITVKPLPTFSLGPVSPTVCLNNLVELNAGGSADSYTWSPLSGLNTPQGNNVSASPSSTQQYTVTGALNSCTTTALITVSVLALPKPVISVSKTHSCVNDTLSLEGFGADYYNWKGPEGILLSGQSASFVATNSWLSGNYTLTAVDLKGCRASATLSLTVHDLPVGTLKSDLWKNCVPFRANFDFKSSFLPLAGWKLDDVHIGSGNLFSYDFTTAGDYTLRGILRDPATGCINTMTFLVEAHPQPLAGFDLSPEKPVENIDEVIFTNTSQGKELTKFNWYFNDNNGYQSQNKNTSYRFTEAGLYPVAMVVTNKWGCQDTAIKAIKIESDLAVYVPNIFTPNDDELNDIFLPVVRGIKFYEILIFDRWGVNVFSTDDPKTGWDGTYRGEPCKQGVYVWKINLSSNNGEMKTMSGQVLLSK